VGRACGAYGDKINAYIVLVGKWYGKNYLIDLSVDGNII
jgi:hypothetical protein